MGSSRAAKLPALGEFGPFTARGQRCQWPSRMCAGARARAWRRRLFAPRQIARFARHHSRKPSMRALFLVIDLALELYIWIVIAAAIFSWLVAFHVVNTRNQVVGMIGEFLYRITEPALHPQPVAESRRYRYFAGRPVPDHHLYSLRDRALHPAERLLADDRDRTTEVERSNSSARPCHPAFNV